jgi:hypothetical protein
LLPLLLLLLHVLQVVVVAGGKEYKVSQIKQLLTDIGQTFLVRLTVTSSAAAKGPCSQRGT